MFPYLINMTAVHNAFMGHISYSVSYNSLINNVHNYNVQ